MDGIRLARVPLLALLLFVPSCRIPELRPGDPGQNLPDTFKGVADTENSADIGIHDFFNDPMLTSLIDQALVGNQGLKILGEEIQIANNEILKRRGAIFPLVTIGTKASLEKPSMFTPAGAVDEQLFYRKGSHFPTPLPNFLVGADISWQVDIWRQLRNARDSAALRYLATTEGRNYVVTRLVAEVAENYYNLMALDKRLENLDRTISFQEESLKRAIAKKEFAQGTELAVQRFQAEVQKNKSEKLVINQEVIEVENKINFLVGRYPEPVQRSSEFFDLNIHPLKYGVPADLLRNRPDVREAERELEAAGLDVLVAKANFYPKLILTGGVGYEAFNTRYLFRSPESLIYGIAGDLVAPLVNKAAIKADYMTANARQLQALYNYQRVVLSAFTEVVNRMAKVDNYTKSIEIKKQQLASLEASVEAATNLFIAARVDYIDVLFAQRDLNDARMVFIETKKQQLSAIVNTYQALGGGLIDFNYPDPMGVMVPVGPALPLPGDPVDMVPIQVPAPAEAGAPVEVAPPAAPGAAVAPGAPVEPAAPAQVNPAPVLPEPVQVEQKP